MTTVTDDAPSGELSLAACGPVVSPPAPLSEVVQRVCAARPALAPLDVEVVVRLWSTILSDHLGDPAVLAQAVEQRALASLDARERAPGPPRRVAVERRRTASG